MLWTTPPERRAILAAAMRTFGLALLLLAACGSGHASPRNVYGPGCDEHVVVDDNGHLRSVWSFPDSG